MASIVENIIGNKALQLGGEEFVRKLSFGNDWRKLRIGIRLIVNGSANIPAPRRLVMGLCDGDQFTYLSGSCLSFAGSGWGLNNGGVWTYDGVNGRYAMYAGGSVHYVLAKVGAAITETSTGDNTPHYVKTGISGTPHMLLVDITRASSSSYTVQGYAPDGTTILNLPDVYNFMLTTESEYYSTLVGIVDTYVDRMNSATATGLSSNLDTLSIYWSLASPTVEITDVCVLRYY